jgi:putative secretion ATPase (PEP-CTERM system associated)
MKTMYDDHYGLSGRPFALTPDPKFWFDTATHRKAMAYLGYGLSQGEGFIVITGDVGAGKTTLVGHLMATIDRERLHVIKLVSSQIEADDLLRMVATGLGVETAGLMKAQLLVAIERGLHSVARSGRRTLLIVDEAQALHTGALEELRMLSNFQAGGHALLQIFLLGQPEFRAALHGGERLEQLRQRVIAMHHLDPMDADEVEPYVMHRLSLVGWSGRPRFTPDAFAALYRGSDGVPRRLNQLAGRVLLFGAIEQVEVIDEKVVEAVIADINGDIPHETAPAPRPAAASTAKPEPVVAPEPAPEPAAVLSARPANDPKPAPVPQPAPIAIAPDRFAAIEARLEEQDAALRRVLALLVDWVEGNEAAAARGGRAA